MLHPMTRLALMLSVSLAFAACGGRIGQIGQAPPLSPITVPPNIAAGAPVLVPQPPSYPVARELNSLWRPGSRSFFRDPRAAKTGDILTVTIDITDQAKIANTTSRSTSASENAALPNFLGLESLLPGVLPDEVDPANLVDLSSQSSSSGTGAVDRSETINLTVAAVVVQVLPNGNLVIQGQQEVRVNNEVRVLLVSGVVRPEDIASNNTIQHTQIAEARISYGGRGHITDVQQPRYGQQFFDIIWPF
jgi:flagellar L-ring protein precursor FlgH